MSRLEKVLLSCSAAVLLAFVALRFGPARQPVLDWVEPPASLLGAPSTPFSLALVDGDTVDLPRQGRRLVVITYRTECPFCEASLPAWERVFSGTCDVDVALVSAEPLDLLREHWSQYGFEACSVISFGQVLDPPAFQAAYEVTGTPQHYLIGAAGEHERVWRGVVRGQASESNFVAGLRP